MTNIGVGIIGASPGGASWAAASHIPALRAVNGFELKAVATSRRSSADAAASAWAVDAYDDPRFLIDHPGVDLVVIAVKVTQHRDLVEQALTAGKMVYCEWPLGASLTEAEHLAELAATAGIRTVIGLQARFAPAVQHMKQLVDDGYLGDVLATTMSGSGIAWGPTTDRAHAYMFDAASGANTLTVPAGHALDALTYVLGDTTRVTATLGVGRKRVAVLDEGTTIPVTAADQVAITAALSSGATVSVFYRGGRSRAGDLRWEINGTDGDLLLTSPSPNGNIQTTDLILTGGTGDADTVRPIQVTHRAELSALPTGPAQNVAGLYAALAEDLADGSQRVPDFARAVVMHRLLADIESQATT
ncbi:Gfo/Idh/MocA family protein [Mycolicibacterium hodleri]|uniref:Gfo/Idh/MocA family oxidoreductase n=1 Tax=Mycolicibacterium hodleri TaxID=49897 RepID=A0A502EAQ7_9MYCO|nr:Gfo/Idh/MocA family oxidoreductase [Mycolicibacterium hodleri]TPG33560.1 gfo/Idh/MocA family oxidoreductase [Mycolicibacterium hodleri]